MSQPRLDGPASAPPRDRLGRLGFKSLRTKLTVAYLALFLLVLMGVMGAVYTSITENAERQVRGALTASAVVFDRIWQLRTDELKHGAELLAQDFGFRAAVASADRATIKSALQSLRERLGLSLAFVTGPDGQLVAQDGLPGTSAEAATLMSLNDDDASGVFVIDGVAYQAVGAPILAPLQIGRVVFAARLDRRELAGLVRLSPIALEPQMLIEERDGRWQAVSSRLSPAELTHAAEILAKDPAGRGVSPQRLGPWMEVVRPLRSLGRERTALLLRYSMAQALMPYQGLLALVLLLGLAGLTLTAAGGWALARAVTRPISDLTEAAKRLEHGDGAQVRVQGRDEIAALGLTFNHMAAEIGRREDALVAARQNAEAANQAKSDFLANMSHEIRTPLNGILGIAQVLAREDADAVLAGRVQVIRESGEALLAILNSILDLSKMEAGQLEIEAANFDLCSVVDAACEPFANLAREKGLTFAIDIDPEVAGAWHGDALRLRQVLANLLSNAVKFTEQGGVEVTVRPAAQGIAFQVKDTGAGIPHEQLERIFERFAQADSSSTRSFGGAGLGLAICQELVGLMGGQITLESELGVGSTFAFETPLTRAQPAESAADVARQEIATDEARSLRILAAEDNPTNQLILSALLEPVDAELVIVQDGLEAVEAFGRERFDIVLMDIQMPNMSGVDAARAIRRLEAERGHRPAPILAVTANVMSHQVAEYSAAGMDGVVAKPIQAEVMYAEIERALEAAQRAAA